jgi:hypothetical protein
MELLRLRAGGGVIISPMTDTSPVTKTLYRKTLLANDAALIQVTFDPAVLGKYREAGYSIKRTRTVGRLKAPSWSIDFGIGPADTSLHASVRSLLALPETERQHWALHTAEPNLSENYLKMLLHPGSCIDDGDTEDW